MIYIILIHWAQTNWINKSLNLLNIVSLIELNIFVKKSISFLITFINFDKIQTVLPTKIDVSFCGFDIISNK